MIKKEKIYANCTKTKIIFETFRNDPASSLEKKYDIRIVKTVKKEMEHAPSLLLNGIRNFGGTADLVRAEGADIENTALVASV